MKTKVLIFSDSLALARSTPEEVNHALTWPNLLRSNFDIHQVSIGGATIMDLCRQISYHKSFDPDIVLLQFGIVDCSPRFMTKFEMEVVRKIPFLGKKLIAFANRKSIRKLRRITYVSKRSFLHHSTVMRKAFSGKRVFSIGIIPASREYEAMLPGISSNIRQYNNILQRVYGVGFISMESFPKDGVMSDFHHINTLGHHYLYGMICSRLESK